MSTKNLNGPNICENGSAECNILQKPCETKCWNVCMVERGVDFAHRKLVLLVFQ